MTVDICFLSGDDAGVSELFKKTPQNQNQNQTETKQNKHPHLQQDPPPPPQPNSKTQTNPQKTHAHKKPHNILEKKVPWKGEEKVQ